MAIQNKKHYEFNVNVTDEPVIDPNVIGEFEDINVEDDWTSLDTLKSHLGFIREDGTRETLKVTIVIGNDEDGVIDTAYAYIMENDELGDNTLRSENGVGSNYGGYGKGKFDNGHNISKTIQALFERMKAGKAMAGIYLPNGKLDLGG